MVIVKLPAGVPDEVARVSVDEPPDETEEGEKVAVAPVGSPAAENATDCAFPDVTAVAKVAVTGPPGAVAPDVDEAATENESACDWDGAGGKLDALAVGPATGRVGATVGE
ncbi:MAG: hypothetical protein QOE61_4792 [Micromonosporaceae bacterium]|jgi:hypothetical protein|nr:hypothetical protein [Micromonosporaceae bacterium]